MKRGRRSTISWLAGLARFGRLGLAPLTVSVPILGALTTGDDLSSGAWLGLGVVGLCAHLFGFALNDLVDYPLDRTVVARQNHPLQTGVLSRPAAWTLMLFQPPLALAIYYGLSGGNLVGPGVLGGSILLSIGYNGWSKWGTLPRLLPELALAASLGLLCLAGALVTGVPLAVGSKLFAFGLAVLLLLLNSVPSGLKDLKTDARFGSRSFVLAGGCRLLEDERLLIPKAVWLYSAVLQGAFLICLLWLLGYFRPAWPVVGLAGLLGLYAALHLRMVLAAPSWSALRRSRPLLSGYYNYTALALVMVDRMPFLLQGLYLLLGLALLLLPWQLSYRMGRGRPILLNL